MNYIDIDFNKVKGFNELTPEQQKLFISTYRLHNSCQGTDYKKEWAPVSVKWIRDKEKPQYSYLKVIFKNGKWLHYTRRGDWY